MYLKYPYSCNEEKENFQQVNEQQLYKYLHNMKLFGHTTNTEKELQRQ